jgi:subtilisin family serine protease
MKQIITLFLIFGLFAPVTLSAQSPRYLIEFTDKDTLNNPYSVEKPGEFLSQKSIERREKQNIKVVLEDLPLSEHYVDSIENIGVEVQNRSRWLNSVVGEIDSTIIDSLVQMSFIENITFLAPPKTISKESGKGGTQDVGITTKLQAKQEKIDSTTYGYAKNQVLMLNGDYLHEKGYQGAGKTIAVIDAGFLMSDTISVFDELWNNGQILGQRNFEEPGHDIYQKGNSSHGTYVLSIIGARMPGIFYGTAPKADFWLLRSEVASSEYLIEEYNWVAAAEFADSAGVDIINTSLGYTTFNDSTQNHTYADMDGENTVISRAASIAASKGMLVVASAGNKGDDPWHYISAPADAKNILSVGAVDEYRTYASFSSVGPSYDDRVKPDVAAQGEGTFFATPDGSIAAGNGTSFAAPLVAGLSACLWQKYPNKTNKEIIEYILKSSSQFNDPDSLMGYGLPDFEKAYMLGAEKLKSSKLKVYPNPFKDSFFIKLPEDPVDSENLTISLYDVTGRKILIKNYSRDAKSARIKVTPSRAIADGVYFLKVKYPNNYQLKVKVVKQ